MKVIITLFFTLLITTFANGQEAKSNLEKEAVNILTTKKVILEKEDSVVRLYMFRNYRVTKALSFRTQKNKAKLA